MKIQGITRRKIGTDGHGVTDLVALAACPLSCEYCLNKRVLAESPVRDITPEDILAEVMQEMCYFVATGGGVAFGGGEPLLQWEELVSFTNIKPDWMQMTIETALQAPSKAIEALMPVTDFWMIDIKTLDSELYQRYTHGSMGIVLSNLELLSDIPEKVRVRVPVIPNYKSRDIAEAEAAAIRDMGFTDIDVFDYVIR